MTLVVTPLQKEFKLLTASLKADGAGGHPKPIGKIPSMTFPELNFIVALGGHGKVQCALHTQYLLERLKDIGLVICAGAAGSLANHLKAGDVVVATQTIEHDYKERFTDNAPPPSWAADLNTLTALKHKLKAAADRFHVYFGPVASGDEDIVTTKRANELRHQTGALAVPLRSASGTESGPEALAVAWEGAGCARASCFHGKPFLEIRAITDMAGASAPRDFSKNLQPAVNNIGLVLIRLCRLRNS
ncbi:MAG: 5'-methylthioadenosine/S-adenosylhomocysteine nucleosidase [Elusimicrobia bacterium]|nr:5'-methylthioadenosine/S-adenosylhomocysteine nucleosidase [Elusimicrobiota bacterium]